MTQCWGDEADAEEQRLKDSFDRVRGWLVGRKQDDVAGSLDEAQVQWGLYRDLHCDVVAGIYEGGSIAGLQRVQCRASLAAARRQQLDAAMAEAAQ